MLWDNEWNLNTDIIFDNIKELLSVFKCDHYIMVMYKIRIVIS